MREKETFEAASPQNKKRQPASPTRPIRTTHTVPTENVQEVAEKMIREHRAALDWLADK
jgi:hypothetical protein